jgi:23S rRNA (adenine2503-C2)-methyltransferase
VKINKIPTGYLFTSEYSRGELETLSIGDYGKQYNVKADFLGYTKPINGVPNTYCMPLSEKWVITVSTQYGCSMKCNFCDVPNIPFNGNASFEDLKQQFYNAISLFPDVHYTDRLNLHFARMGEPINNPEVMDFAQWIYENKDVIREDVGLRIETLHPVLTTSLPDRTPRLLQKLERWAKIKNRIYNGQAGLQLSINSTDEGQRQEMFCGRAMPLAKIADIVDKLPNPVGRKYCLNFAYSTDYKIDAKLLAMMFDTEKVMCKITPIHNNSACTDNNIKTIGGYESWNPYQKPEEELKNAGFDVLVFVPSMDEEDGLVTCGNLILGGSRLKAVDARLKITGIN